MFCDKNELNNFIGDSFMILWFLFSTIISILLLKKFISMRKNREYSSKMYLIGSLNAYLIFNLIFVTIDVFYLKENFTIRTLASQIKDTGFLIVFMTMPLAILESLFLIITNIRLNIKEGFSKYNMLGIATDILWGALSYTVLYFSNLSGSEMYVMIMSAVDTLIAFINCYYICIFNSVAFCSYLAVNHKPEYNQDYIIILGCKIKKDGTPTRLLEDRINGAIKFENEQFEKSGKHCTFITSGGQGKDEIISEAESMKKYLISKGIDENNILIENKSTNTYQNIKNSLELINDENANISIATTNYHLFRSLLLSRNFKKNISGISGRTKWYFYPNGFLREFIGILHKDRKKHTIILGTILIVCTILSIYVWKSQINIEL